MPRRRSDVRNANLRLSAGLKKQAASSLTEHAPEPQPYVDPRSAQPPLFRVANETADELIRPRLEDRLAQSLRRALFIRQKHHRIHRRGQLGEYRRICRKTDRVSSQHQSPSMSRARNDINQWPIDALRRASGADPIDL